MEELCISFLFWSVQTTPSPSVFLETIGTDDLSFLTALFRTHHWVFCLFFSTWSPEGTCKRRAPVLTWILTNKTLNMTAQLPGFTEGSNSPTQDSLLAHIPTRLPEKSFPPEGGIYLLLPQRKSMSQSRNKWGRKGIQLSTSESESLSSFPADRWDQMNRIENWISNAEVIIKIFKSL